ncbi:MAG TPA: glycine cleavage T C-terminal barrel domain-containing protein [Acidimicrobiales bacterium]|nr:glycine cleavage T C-terminal barrel domain-containing protein [Acidimicrobiales bacterium]
MDDTAEAVAAGYRALRGAAGAVDVARDVVRVAGPDSATFLQGQLSQDVTTIAAGGSAWSFLLAPQGKVVALLRVTRQSDDSFLLDTDGGWGEAMVERLRRFKLRVKCDFEPLAWRCIGVRGPAAHDLAAHDLAAGAADGASVLAVDADWPGLPGVDLLGEAPSAPAGAVACPPAAYEAVRIECGIPVMGRELDESTIPAEAGVVDATVSFTKGCYTGQELVARIDSRGGNVPRHLRGLVFDGAESSVGAVPPLGAVLRAGDKQVGSLTSVARSLTLGAPVALAYVGRAVSPPADVDVVWEDGSARARVEMLPLVT